MSTPFDIRERTFLFATHVVVLCRALNAEKDIPRALTGQLIRSATSVGANIEEAYGGQSPRDFISKLSISGKEARESHYWLRLLVSTESVDSRRVEALIDEARQLVAIITTMAKKAEAGAAAKRRKGEG